MALCLASLAMNMVLCLASLAMSSSVAASSMSGQQVLTELLQPLSQPSSTLLQWQGITHILTPQTP
eukprot:71847-Chlamydomonas_euryale.AAC.2